MARPRLRDQTAGADDHVRFDPGWLGEAVVTEAHLERPGDDGIVIATVERPFDLHLAYRFGDLVQFIGRHGPERLDQFSWLRHHARMVATVQFATPVANQHLAQGVPGP